MNTLKASIAIAALAALPASAADYDYIDAGDVYYLNDWGTDNRRVLVVRKMGGQSVKVRDVVTGETSVVAASSLLTSSELQMEEFENTVVGTGVAIVVLGCLLDPESCE